MASSDGSITGASGVARIAALMSFNPLPVLNASTGSSCSILPSASALTTPAYEAAPAGSAKIPTFPKLAMAFRMSASLTIIYDPFVWVAARTARTPSRGKSTEMLSASVFADTGLIFLDQE